MPSTLARFSCALAAAIPIATGCSTIEEFVGKDTAPHTSMCLVIAPDHLPADDLGRALLDTVAAVVEDRGHLDGVVAVGPSAASFPRIVLKGGGDLKAGAGTEKGRDGSIVGSVMAEIDAQVSLTVATDDGLDLIGGIEACARLLTGDGPHRIVVISHGVHRTADLDLATNPEQAARDLPARVMAVLPADVELLMLGLGRIEPQKGDAPNRDMVEHTLEAWDSVCRQLATRCLKEHS
jgi:hypothetical protein